jgi:hypothetical protein
MRDGNCFFIKIYSLFLTLVIEGCANVVKISPINFHILGHPDKTELYLPINSKDQIYCLNADLGKVAFLCLFYQHLTIKASLLSVSVFYPDIPIGVYQG